MFFPKKSTIYLSTFNCTNIILHMLLTKNEFQFLQIFGPIITSFKGQEISKTFFFETPLPKKDFFVVNHSKTKKVSTWKLQSYSSRCSQKLLIIGLKLFFHYCQLAQNQPKYHILLHKNGSLCDFYIMTLVKMLLQKWFQLIVLSYSLGQVEHDFYFLSDLKS